MLDRQKFVDVALCLKCPVIFEVSVGPLTQNDLLVDRPGIASSSLYVVLRDKTLVIEQQVEARYTILQGKGVCVVYEAEGHKQRRILGPAQSGGHPPTTCQAPPEEHACSGE